VRKGYRAIVCQNEEYIPPQCAVFEAGSYKMAGIACQGAEPIEGRMSFIRVEKV